LWAASVHDGEHKEGFLNLNDQEWSRRPTDEGHWNCTDEVIKENHCVSQYKLADKMSISSE
jgi:hypothetical protein